MKRLLEKLTQGQSKTMHTLKKILLAGSTLLLLFYFSNVVAAYTSAPNTNKSTSVEIALFVNDIANIDEKNETFSMDAQLFLRWQDSRLAFNANRARTKVKTFMGGAAEVQLNEMWRPYLVLQDNRSQKKVEARLLTINAKGIVEYTERFNTILETKLDMRKFPFDKQRISIKLVSFPGSSPIALSTVKVKEGTASNAHLEEWRVTDRITKVSNDKTQSEYNIKIYYERKSGYYLSKVILPFLIVVALSWLVFWISNQALVNRVGLLLTALLTLVAFQWVIAGTIPKITYHIFIDVLLLFSFAMIGFAMLCLVISNQMQQAASIRFETHLRWVLPLIYLTGLLITVFVFFF